MPYIGHEPTNSGNFYILDDFNGLGQDGGSSTYDQNANGTIVNFKLMVAGVAITPNVDNLIVTIDGVLQHPTDAYTISGSILTFTGAPASGVDFHVVIMGQSSTVGEGSIGADELQVSGDGTNNQLLKTDGDGTFSWINQNTVTASTAVTLATARAINGVNFDGSAAITVTSAAGTLSGNTLKSTVVASSLTSVGTLTNFTSTGIDDNAGQTALSISSEGRVQHTSAIANSCFDIANTHADGYGAHIQAGSGTKYSLVVKDKDNNERFTVLGNGNATFTGDVAVSSSDPTITIKRSNNSAFAGHIDFTNNADTLGWQVGTNQVTGDGFEVNYGASNKFYVKTDGKVGIGCSPGFTLDVQSTGDVIAWRTSAGLLGKLGYNGSDTDNGQIVINDAGSEKIRLLANGASYFNGGNVGIGTGGSNDRLLHVQGGANSNTGVIKIEGGQPWLEMQSSANTWAMYVGDAGGGDFYIRDGDPTGGTDYVTINAGDGFVGINHGDPKKMLHIRKNNSDCMVILDAQDSIADKQICFAEDYGSGSTNDGQYWGVGVDASEGPDFVIAYDQNSQPSMGGDDDLVRITAGGVMTFSMGDAAAQFAEYESGGIIWIDGANGDLSGGDYWGLQAVNGGGSFRIKRAGTTKVTVDSSGNMDIAGSLTESSDIRLKENIEAIPNALSKVNQMRGVHFNKKGSDEKLVGMIADEVEKIIPELVTTATEKGKLDTESLDNLKSLRYSNIVAVLVEAVKELSAEVEALKNG